MDVFQKCRDYDRADSLREAGVYRYFRRIASQQDPVVRIDGKELIMLGSNNYLGLASHPEVKAAAAAAIEQFGTGCAGSPLLNGSLTIGTLDGANVEIQEEVGPDNIFIFGLTVEEVEALQAKGYNPYDVYHADEELKAVIDWLGSSYFTPHEGDAFGQLHHSLLAGGDPFKVLADFRAYSDAQARVDAAYRDQSKWARMAILNTARMGKFSSDRTIREYAQQIWSLPQVKVD